MNISYFWSFTHIKSRRSDSITWDLILVWEGCVGSSWHRNDQIIFVAKLCILWTAFLHLDNVCINIYFLSSFLDFRASLDNVFFPSVTLCNINQGRRSFFLQHGLHHDSKMLQAVLGQAYFGLEQNLSDPQMTRYHHALHTAYFPSHCSYESTLWKGYIF